MKRLLLVLGIFAIGIGLYVIGTFNLQDLTDNCISGIGIDAKKCDYLFIEIPQGDVNFFTLSPVGWSHIQVPFGVNVKNAQIHRGEMANFSTSMGMNVWNRVRIKNNCEACESMTVVFIRPHGFFPRLFQLTKFK